MLIESVYQFGVIRMEENVIKISIAKTASVIFQCIHDWNEMVFFLAADKN